MWMAMICNEMTSYYFPGFRPSSHHMWYEKNSKSRGMRLGNVYEFLTWYPIVYIQYSNRNSQS